MRILYIHQYFRTPQDGGSIRSYHLAKGMVQAGHEVCMLTSHNKSNLKVTIIEGIKVVYLPVKYENRFGFIQRIWAFMAFVVMTYRYLRKNINFDLAYITSTPLTVGLLGIWLKKYRKLPYIFEVRDLWPEAPIQMGVIKNPLLKRILYQLEKRIYLHAEKIVALSPGMRNDIEQKIKKKPVHLVCNIADTQFFTPVKTKPKDLLVKFGCNEEFVISYFGAAGKVNSLEFLVNACAHLEKTSYTVKCLVMAEGSELENIKKLCADKQLSNISFFDFGGKNEVRELLNISDAVYVSFADLPVLGTNSPNKFFDGLAAGKLIIVNNRGWISELIEQHHCGIYADPHHPKQLVDKLAHFIREPELLFKFQKNSRQLATEFFDKEIQIEKVLKVIDPHHQKRDAKGNGISLTA
jgi:glycosyltransferase involved in cell wall biosynthesis